LLVDFDSSGTDTDWCGTRKLGKFLQEYEKVTTDDRRRRTEIPIINELGLTGFGWRCTWWGG
jgi:hypothetical protein